MDTLQTGTAALNNNAFSLNLPALSVTAVITKGKGSSTGVDEAERRKELAIYPNPISSDENITIDLKSDYSGVLQTEVYNTLGQLVYSKKQVSASLQLLELPCSFLAKGMYTIHISGNDQQWFSKFVKN